MSYLCEKEQQNKIKKKKIMKTLYRRTITSLWDTPKSKIVRIRAHDVIYSYRRFSANLQQRPVSNLLTNNQQKLLSIRKLLISSKTAVGPIQYNNNNQSLLISKKPSPKFFSKLFSANRVFSKFIFSYNTAADVYSLFGWIVNRNLTCDKTYRIVSSIKSSVYCPLKQFHSDSLSMGWPSEYDRTEQTEVYKHFRRK